VLSDLDPEVLRNGWLTSASLVQCSVTSLVRQRWRICAHALVGGILDYQHILYCFMASRTKNIQMPATNTSARPCRVSGGRFTISQPRPRPHHKARASPGGA
jgi:hypothetical protein